MTHVGSCFCGAVTLEVTGAPEGMGYRTAAPVVPGRAGLVNASASGSRRPCGSRSGAEHVATLPEDADCSQRTYCRKCGGHLMTNHPPLEARRRVRRDDPHARLVPGVHINYAESGPAHEGRAPEAEGTSGRRVRPGFWPDSVPGSGPRSEWEAGARPRMRAARATVLCSR